MTIYLSIGISMLLLLYYRFRLRGEREWNRMDAIDAESAYFETQFSIIIAFRNEVSNLDKLFSSIEQLDYPSSNFEVILVNDESEDESLSLAEQFVQNSTLSISLLNSQGGKKRAVHAGIQEAKGEFVLTTDADCLLPARWLKAFDALLEDSELDFIAGPVVFEGSGFLSKIFTLEFDSLQAGTVLGIATKRATMSNGANLCLRREMYTDLHSLQPHIASGEDVFLMTFIKKQLGRNKIGYCKSSDAIVTTAPPEDLQAYYSQRIRWTSKSKAYRDWDIISTALSVLLFNAWIFTLLVIGIWEFDFILLGGVLLTSKAFIDFYILSEYLVFFKRQSILKYFPIAFLFTLISTSVIGILGQFVKVKWKGRRI